MLYSRTCARGGLDEDNVADVVSLPCDLEFAVNECESATTWSPPGHPHHLEIKVHDEEEEEEEEQNEIEDIMM